VKPLLSVVKNWWPDTLFGRLILIWGATLLIGHLLDVAASYSTVTNYQVTRSDYYLSKDVAILVPMLENAAPPERTLWMKRMERQDYRYESRTSTGTEASPASAPRVREMVNALMHELGPSYRVSATASTNPDEQYELHVQIKDGTTLTIHLNKINVKLPWWGGLAFLAQVLTLIILTWFAVRQAMQPLLRLAEASEALGSSLQCDSIAESGPSEVARAAKAFNAMQRRITEHLAERVHILASISHDLQTPITRMRLRTDLMESGTQRDKLHGDLNAMQVLVEEGIAYARSAHSVNEILCRVDVDALLDSLVCDYVDGGQSIALKGRADCIITTKPHALRRIVSNLADNAFKFGEQVEIEITQPAAGHLTISVLDRGPGIPADELAAVLKPFYRLEESRNRHSGGTGLGLAIAQQLSGALGAVLVLSNRVGGGLQASISMPARDLKFAT